MSPLSRYPNEDRRPTSTKELWGWFSYGVAAESFAIVAVGSFIPVFLEQLARERGFLRSDPSVPCSAAAAAPPSQQHAPVRDDGAAGESNQCIVRVFGSEINTASFSLYTSSIAVFVQALLFVTLSAIADHGSHRKRILITLGAVGSLSSMLFIFITPETYLLAPVLVIIGVACLGSSFVLLNSFLPLLVVNDPSVAPDLSNEDISLSSLDDIDTPRSSFEQDDLSSSNQAPHHDDLFEAKDTLQATTVLKLSDRISAKGVSLGYAAAVLVQILSISILILFSKLSLTTSKTLPVRVVLLLVGLWWASFTIPTALWLRPRPGPPIPTAQHASSKPLRRCLSYVVFSWRSLWHTIKIVIRMRQVVVFLLAWFLLSDALATVSGTAILFARTELQMSTTGVALLSMTVTISGILGAWLWPRVTQRYGLKGNHTIMLCIGVFEIIPLYGLLGFVPFVRALGWGGLQKTWEFYPLGFVHGLVMGGLSSLCRSFYGLLIPAGSEAAFYALYAVTDKGSSVIGPTIVGRIVDRTGSVRLSFWFLAVLVLLPLAILFWVDPEKGRRDAVAAAAAAGAGGMRDRSYQHVQTDDGELEELEERLLTRQH